MKQAKKHRKLFYVPGMISLVLLPLFCLYFFYSGKSFDKVRCVSIAMSNERTVTEFELNNDISLTRDYKDFIFNGNLEKEKSNLKKFTLSLREQNSLKDTVHGIKIHLDKAKYEVFIRVLDILSQEKTNTYAIFGTTIWVLNGHAHETPEQKKWREEHPPMNCGTQDAINYQIALRKENQRLMEKKDSQKTFFDNHSYLYLIYFGIVLLNIFAVIKFNKDKKYNQKSYI
jgi:hypothetical protein